jgi:membrane-bound serine protease (ClpP class)
MAAIMLSILSILFFPLPGATAEVTSLDVSIDVAAHSAGVTKIYIAEIDGVVGVPLEEHVESVFKTVGDGDNKILIFKMDTPGGLVDSMSAIISRIAEANYPVVVWVTPSAASAASAGAFIAQAAHITAMAPGTHIGAAHPVMGGGDIKDGDMKTKIVNDLTAMMRSFAQERGRNVEVAESMVTDSVSLTAREALEQGVIDFIAADEKELFDQLDGWVVDIKGEPRVLSLENRESERIDMTLRLRALELFSRPDIAYLALIAGVFLIILEARAPGGFVMGITGGVLLLIASYGMRVLPVNLAGVALLLGGILVIILDLIFGGMGIIAAAGIGAMFFGGLMLFRAQGGELLNLSMGFVTGVTAVISIVFLLIMRLIVKALRRRPASGQDALVGERVKVIGRTGNNNMMALVHGEYWRVLPTDSYLELGVGDEVEVLEVSSLILHVRLVKRAQAKTFPMGTGDTAQKEQKNQKEPYDKNDSYNSREE